MKSILIKFFQVLFVLLISLIIDQQDSLADSKIEIQSTSSNVNSAIQGYANTNVTCADISDLSPADTPIEIIRQYGKCLDSQELERAIEVEFAAKLYAYYVSLFFADQFLDAKIAHEFNYVHSKYVPMMQKLSNLGFETYKLGSKNLKKLCEAILAKGRPTYDNSTFEQLLSRKPKASTPSIKALSPEEAWDQAIFKESACPLPADSNGNKASTKYHDQAKILFAERDTLKQKNKNLSNEYREKNVQGMFNDSETFRKEGELYSTRKHELEEEINKTGCSADLNYMQGLRMDIREYAEESEVLKIEQEIQRVYDRLGKEGCSRYNTNNATWKNPFF